MAWIERAESVTESNIMNEWNQCAMTCILLFGEMRREGGTKVSWSPLRDVAAVSTKWVMCPFLSHGAKKTVPDPSGAAAADTGTTGIT